MAAGRWQVLPQRCADDDTAIAPFPAESRLAPLIEFLGQITPPAPPPQNPALVARGAEETTGVDDHHIGFGRIDDDINAAGKEIGDDPLGINEVFRTAETDERDLAAVQGSHSQHAYPDDRQDLTLVVGGFSGLLDSGGPFGGGHHDLSTSRSLVVSDDPVRLHAVYCRCGLGEGETQFTLKQGDGFNAWKELHERYNATTAGGEVGDLAAVLSPKREKDAGVTDKLCLAL